ncbi:MAG: hypothetical protein J3Q66DRAFT_375156 [Benniella sp.]|nr:MAG: hypothetical protein J3Q66DRAFT_375156 [Benniella sp.]
MLFRCPPISGSFVLVWTQSRETKTASFQNSDSDDRWRDATLSKLKPSEPRSHKSQEKFEDAANVAETVKEENAEDTAQEDVTMEDVAMDTDQFDINMDEADVSMNAIAKLIENVESHTKVNSDEVTINDDTAEEETKSTAEVTIDEDSINENTRRARTNFTKAFKIVSLTLGCLTGALRRAMSMNQQEARAVADPMNIAAHILSKARILVFKGVEHFVYQQLESLQSKNVVPSSMIGSQEPESSSAADTSMTDQALDTTEPSPATDTSLPNHALDTCTSGTSTGTSETDAAMKPLDLLLDDQHGRTLIRNLGPLEIYEGLKKDFPGIMSLKKMAAGKMSLSVPNGDMAANIHTAIRVHFGRLPEFTTTKTSDGVFVHEVRFFNVCILVCIGAVVRCTYFEIMLFNQGPKTSSSLSE